MHEKVKAASSRIIALDYLRGFFITIIIVDHIWRWPNLYQLLSGRGELWVSAAEGFVIISGLLVGYVHGFKKRQLALREISFKLFRRGIMLYIWMFITTFIIVAAAWLLNSKGPVGYIPIAQNDWLGLANSMLRLDFVHSLTHFLYLYAVYLIIAPAAIWLLRRRQDWIVGLVSLGVWLLGYTIEVEWMQWQILFFWAAIIGYHFDAIIAKFRSLPAVQKNALRVSTIVLLVVTFSISLFAVLPISPGQVPHSIFGREPLTLPTILMAFLWFAGLLSLFQYILPFLQRWFSWLLLTFGERSLTAYIVHIVPIIIIQWLLPATENFMVNTLIVTVAIIGTWALLRIPNINRIIPR